jgi:hypothetical protein
VLVEPACAVDVVEVVVDAEAALLEPPPLHPAPTRAAIQHAARVGRVLGTKDQSCRRRGAATVRQPSP